MKLKQLTVKQSLNKAYRLLRPDRADIEKFKSNFRLLLGHINPQESEENMKGHVMDFLKNTYFNPDYHIATKGRTDFVIHTGKNASHPAGVLFEVKRPSNHEMVSLSNLNTKAMHEIILYYLRERIGHHNNDIKYLVITNIYEWFVFDAPEFERLFFKNTGLVKDYNAWMAKQKVSTNNDLFYNEIAKPFLAALSEEIEFTWFDIRGFEEPLRDTDRNNDNLLIPLFKTLSPTHLLKLPFANDSNTLDKGFYRELLYLIGLEEVKQGSKKIIRRREAGKKHDGSLLENTILQLETENCIHKVTDLPSYGDTAEDQLFSVALELCITWINRILFLKLLEAQLLKYHNGNKDYRFLNYSFIPQYDELYKLFFRVLAKKKEERIDRVKAKYKHIPYLNSSLFEITPLEEQTIRINMLDDSAEIPLLSATVLRDDRNKPIAAKLNTLQYLLGFLDAYDFASEGSEGIQEERKTLINASVLGLIFEKINGYEDGSIFTPGFITMYMCRQSIRQAVVNKFKEKYNWKAETFEDLHNYISDDRSAKTIKEYNAQINSLTICDPAVGSGHFLVSALNELMAIKSELGILADTNGKRLSEHTATVENDELLVTDSERNFFAYHVAAANGRITILSHEIQRVQETLFHEKQTIIENCLFGVDINPKSVQICRLRLWIELLKNAYYIAEGSNSNGELQTLPNIDINIKTGNSLISKFGLEDDLKPALAKSKFNIQAYKVAVQTYREATNKEQKREMESLISIIKKDFTTELSFRDKLAKSYIKEKASITNISSEINRMELWKEKIPKKLLDDLEKASVKLDKLDKEIKDKQNSVMFRNSFEWRFEFPEVLDNDGNFIGFDVIITNPPYVFARENFTPAMKDYFIENYKTSQYQVNLFLLFIERAIPILKNKGQYSLIIPNSLLMVSSAQKLRKHLLEETALHEIINLMGSTFEGINVEAIIISGNRQNKNHSNKISIYVNEGAEFVLSHTKEQNLFIKNEGSELTVFSNDVSDELTIKLKSGSKILDDLVKIKAGLQAYETNKGNPKQTPEDVKARPYDYNYKFDNNTHKYLEGKDVCRYELKWSGTYLKYGDHLAAPRNFDIFSGRKIIIREITGKFPQSIISAYSEDIFLFNRSNIALVENEKRTVSLKYILAVLNSKLISYYYINNTAKSVRQLFPKLILEDLRKFPVKEISSKNQQAFIALVDEILDTKKEGKASAYLEAQIDQLVYQLYNLTPEEIQIIESSIK